MNDTTAGNNGDTVDDFVTIPDIPIVPINSINNPNQIRSGVTRGIQQLGSDKVYSDGGNNQIIVEDTNEPRVMMGNQTTFGEGFYVTKDGFNVKTNTDPANFIFNSNQNTFKIVQTGTGTMPIATYTTVTKIVGFANNNSQIAHGLSYTPICMGFITAFLGSAQSQLLPATTLSGGSGTRTITEHYQILADNTYVYLTSTISYVSNTAESRTDASTAYAIKYYLLQETAN